MNFRPLTEECRKFLAVCEGAPGTDGKPVLKAYKDSKGVWTIGIGHTGPEVRSGLVITEAEAWRIFDQDLHEAIDVVCSKVLVDLNDHQYGALVSFAFNVGWDQFASSTLLRKLNQGDYKAVPIELAKWVKITKTEKLADGKVRTWKEDLPGLVNRRNLEIRLWSLPVEDIAPIGKISVPAPQMTLPGIEVPKAAPVIQEAIRIDTANEVPTAPVQKVTEVPGGKASITTIVTGIAGAITAGYSQIAPTVAAIKQIASDTAGMTQWTRVIALTLVAVSIGTSIYVVWQKRKELKEAA
ncbi:lysozyme [Dyella telluris]|uniref:Lysozyme n=1 Tax=Dyella telluris TaxID=2763498 RepID=A0A7G8Q4E4_9GAMM|nr:lysozyme [Dyella telluris]QNK01652.1 lysozyme [Dyella telluris]